MSPSVLHINRRRVRGLRQGEAVVLPVEDLRQHQHRVSQRPAPAACRPVIVSPGVGARCALRRRRRPAGAHQDEDVRRDAVIGQRADRDEEEVALVRGPAQDLGQVVLPSRT
jgi:hypothetical protein